MRWFGLGRATIQLLFAASALVRSIYDRAT
jgi:hypothetical protein